jgi:hypothetical protein
MFQQTIEPLAGTTRPRGNVHTTPTLASVPFQRRRKISGTVGDVVHAIDPFTAEAGSPGSSAWNSTLVGVVAAACGVPTPICEAMAVNWMYENSKIFGRSVEGASARTVFAVEPDVKTVVRRASE